MRIRNLTKNLKASFTVAKNIALTGVMIQVWAATLVGFPIYLKLTQEKNGDRDKSENILEEKATFKEEQIPVMS